MQKALSFFVGIFCMLGWQTSLAAVCYVSQLAILWYSFHGMTVAESSSSRQAAGQQVIALAHLGNYAFASTNWEISLISFAILGFVILVNTVLFRHLPLIEGTIMVFNCVAF